jgi:glycosyltransferase involved in cell wall biosynthesis
VGVFANNEEGSIVHHLDSLFAQRTRDVAIREVIVVSSGSSDRTDARVAGEIAKHPTLRLLTQPRREGKASAVNLFLSAASHPHCVLANADTLLDENAIEELARPLRDPRIAMVGGHPVPVSPQRGVLAALARLFWELHHRLCLRRPKMGELVAFRRVFDRLPTDEAGADEDWIHSEIVRQGYQAAYAPGAILYNCGQRSLRDLVAHRCRMSVQHRELGAHRRQVPSSRDLRLLLAVYFGHLADHPREVATVLALGAVEVFGRALAYVRWHRGETCAVWRPLTSKGISPVEVAAYLARTRRLSGAAASATRSMASPPPGGEVTPIPTTDQTVAT